VDRKAHRSFEESAVEEVMGRIAADMGGALGVLLTALGT